jgi:hypothetical protein
MSKGFTLIVPSLHHDFADHLRVNRAGIGEGSRLGKLVRELFVRIHHFGLEGTLSANRRVSDVVSIRPCHGRAHRHRQRSRRKAEVVDLYLVLSDFCCAFTIKLW